MRYFFDDYVLDSDRRELRRGAGLVALEPKVFDLLAYLIRNRQRVVSKDDLFAAVWQGRFVSESALTTPINAARRAVGDSGEEQRLIRTLRHKGFRFVGAVREESEPAAASAADIAPDPPAPALALPDRPSIAVLPFANMSSDPEQEHFADGMVEDIITLLSRLRWLFVIARTSTFTYKGRATDVKQIGRELGVRYALEGSVRRMAERVRITVQLIEAETGAHVWAKRYDRPVRDIFAVQDQITDEITRALEPEIDASERERARRKPPESLDAWELFQRGMWHLLQHNREGFIDAEVFFRQAIALDPTFAAPHAGVALVGFFRVVRALTDEPAPILVEMLEEASRAVALDPREPLGHTALGLTFMERGEYAHSIAEHEIALALSPNSSFARWSYAFGLLWADLYEEALEEFDAALRLSPRDPGRWSYLTQKAATLYQLRRYEEAAECAREATRQASAEVLWAFMYLAASSAQLGRAEEAEAAVGGFLRRRPGWSLATVRSVLSARHRAEPALQHILDGLRKAGLSEQPNSAARRRR